MNDPIFADFVREHRLALNLSLRAFCQKHGEDPSNWSKMERGVLRPPESSERLLDIAHKLRIASNERLKRQLFDLAAAQSGRIPEDIMCDAGLVAKLPVVFRSLRGDEPTEDELMRLADLIRNEATPRNEPAK
ncbi:MAG: helix-turn-helix transcriptional regulator [Candidatus Sumerlaeota bacterium]|nr:helix-turn-helix transcriptional regulator [Candidatus Sumerlaeota bacterium]